MDATRRQRRKNPFFDQPSRHSVGKSDASFDRLTIWVTKMNRIDWMPEKKTELTYGKAR